MTVTAPAPAVSRSGRRRRRRRTLLAPPPPSSSSSSSPFRFLLRRSKNFASTTTKTAVLLLVLLVRPRVAASFAAPTMTTVTTTTMRPKSWDYKGHRIGYEEARRNGRGVVLDDDENDDGKKNPVLLLNGFGVGTFHQHRLVPRLLQSSSDEVGDNGDDIFDVGASGRGDVYAVDYLGQGRSWPVNCDDGDSENEKGLAYSIDTWADQILAFIEEVILTDDEDKKKVTVVGNSVGGLLAILLASRRPDLIESLCLLNATPIWGSNLPGWSGELPAPSIPKRIGRYLFDAIRDEGTIGKYLEAAYANKEAVDDDLIRRIRDCTEGAGGHAAFASILWSPPPTFPTADDGAPKDLYSTLSSLECDVLLAFGKDDPWCKPAFAKRMLKSLRERDAVTSRYVEIENVGHCPNHEAPNATGRLLSRWIDAGSGRRSRDDLDLVVPDGNGDDDSEGGGGETVVEPWGGSVVMRQINGEDAEAMSLGDRILTELV